MITNQVSHFVSDLHQPLHVAYAHDAGGNGQAIDGLGGSVDDLHGVWDRHLLADYEDDWAAAAARLQQDVNPIDRHLWLGADPLQWAAESYRLTEDVVYEGLEGPDGSRLGPEYVARNRPVAELRVKMAGVRLGALLNEAFSQE